MNKNEAEEILELINEIGLTRKMKRNLLVIKFDLSFEEAAKLCPDIGGDY